VPNIKTLPLLFPADADLNLYQLEICQK